MYSVSLVALLSAISAVTALQVTSPGNTSSWTSTGSNSIAWQRVSTDPTNFTVVLTNTDRSVLPTNDQVLINFVQADSQSSTSFDAPDGGLNVGGNYRVNLVKSSDELSTIYAQSDEFEIVASDSSSTTSSGTKTSSSTGANT